MTTFQKKWLTILILVLGILLFVQYLLGAPAIAKELRFAILEGDSIQRIAIDLEEQSLIRSQAMFKVYSAISGSAHRLKPGVYLFEQDATIPIIVRTLTRGPQERSILITEGKSVQDIDSQLTDQGFIKKHAITSLSPNDFSYPFLENVTSFEGFLFPDTYRLFPDASASNIVARFLDAFDEKVWPELESLDPDDWYDVLITASLIEKEVPEPEDRRIVSGIIKKRLSLGIPLQIDATVIFSKCGGSDMCDPLTKSDFEIESDFNTYRTRGLPPTPITNPGRDAIEAALQPKSSPYLYYLSDPETKKTIFSKTLEEHNVARSRYLQL